MSTSEHILNTVLIKSIMTRPGYIHLYVQSDLIRRVLSPNWCSHTSLPLPDVPLCQAVDIRGEGPHIDVDQRPRDSGQAGGSGVDQEAAGEGLVGGRWMKDGEGGQTSIDNIQITTWSHTTSHSAWYDLSSMCILCAYYLTGVMASA